MNIVDLIIIVWVLMAAARGLQVGVFRFVGSYGGFVVGVLVGSWLAGRLAPHYNRPLTKLIIILSIEMTLALLFAVLGEVAAQHLDQHAIRLKLGKLNQILGAGLEIVLTLGLVWLGASALANVASYNIGHDIKRSAIVQRLDALLPQPPDVLARLEKIISPNGFPNAFLGVEPRHTTISPRNSVDNKAVLAAESSVVKIQGVGCGGIVNGSGFVVGEGEVVTNAHVIAGIRDPEVVDGTGTYPAVPVLFDAEMDIAVLRVDNLPDAALPLARQTLPNDDAAAVLGFPGGGPLVAEDAAIIDHITAAGRNIYNHGVVLRNIYEVQADVEPGNSGGPLVSADGSVAGIVFAKSLSQNNVGYAILIDEVKGLIQRAETQQTRVATGACAQD